MNKPHRQTRTPLPAFRKGSGLMPSRPILSKLDRLRRKRVKTATAED